MRFYHLLTLLIATSLFPACDLRQPVEPVDITTHTVTLTAGVTAADITTEAFSSSELETIRLAIKSSGTATLTESEYTRLKEYTEVVKGVPDADPRVTTFLGQLNY
jgi:hypothetical protein